MDKIQKNDYGSLCTEMYEILHEKAPEKEEDFDKKHSDLCAIWCRHFSGSDLGTYGKAQKIINMSIAKNAACVMPQKQNYKRRKNIIGRQIRIIYIYK